MDLTQFNFSILKKFDRTLESNIERLVKNADSIEEDLSPIELKGMLCEALGLDILDNNSSQVVDQGENIQITFAYILKCLSLYPLQNEMYQNWNKHVALFDRAELTGFSEQSIAELHRFIQSIVVTGHEHNYVSLEKMQQPIHLIMLLFIHLDAILTLDSNMEPLCFTQLFKFRFKKNKPYGPSNSFSDFIIYSLASHANKKPLEKLPTISSFDKYLNTELVDDDSDNDVTEHPSIKTMRQLLKKMRAEDRFCYLTDIDQFFTTPFDQVKLIFDDLYEKITESNSRFLLSRTIKDDDFVIFNEMNALWLIYYFQFLVYEVQKTNPPEVLQGLSSTREFMDLWKMFYVPNGKKATFQWPSQFNEIAKIT
ncbi:hypothetical protein [Acinetobacter piscicola]|uniref:hypothetical protein n=1 Tax=Acinetobacter piscicola TaxID=2006115 RepID=UPI00101F3191|nr:hypothetical protein [Acinetobacter piscicola]RYL24613.1 hypothetical protein EWP19_15370 [Acinetobacter piscicola]